MWEYFSFWNIIVSSMVCLRNGVVSNWAILQNTTQSAVLNYYVCIFNMSFHGKELLI